MSPDAVLYAFLGGLVPALLWLWFFLREDRRHPEPKKFIVIAFLAGMASVLFVLPAERLALSFFSGTALTIVWAGIEELFKYFAAAISVLWRNAVDEPIDAIVYMITVALGFAALETGLFLLEPLMDGDISAGILTGNLRFVGAALLHTLSSAAIGIMISLAFYKRPAVRRLYLYTGLVIATSLHTLFNFFIMAQNGKHIPLVFFFVWVGIIALFLMFERAKRITRPVPNVR
jgi:RsiW-degrading membrane proteinase PrsW (M82 family)